MSSAGDPDGEWVGAVNSTPYPLEMEKNHHLRGPPLTSVGGIDFFISRKFWYLVKGKKGETTAGFF